LIVYFHDVTGADRNPVWAWMTKKQVMAMTQWMEISIHQQLLIIICTYPHLQSLATEAYSTDHIQATRLSTYSSSTTDLLE
jgi:hypothetical protein